LNGDVIRLRFDDAVAREAGIERSVGVEARDDGAGAVSDRDDLPVRLHDSFRDRRVFKLAAGEVARGRAVRAEGRVERPVRVETAQDVRVLLSYK
jgi:hypothetical protein